MPYNDSDSFSLLYATGTVRVVTGAVTDSKEVFVALLLQTSVCVVSLYTNLDISLSCTVRVYLTSQHTPMQGPPRGRHVYVVGLLHRWNKVAQ